MEAPAAGEGSGTVGESRWKNEGEGEGMTVIAKEEDSCGRTSRGDLGKKGLCDGTRVMMPPRLSRWAAPKVREDLGEMNHTSPTEIYKEADISVE